MSEKYEDLVSTRETPQDEPIPGREDEMVEGRAGGQVFPVDCWTRLDRFLVLGSSDGTYYADARELTRENAEAVLECLDEDGERTVRRIVEVSDEGRAASNEPALFALALASADGPTDESEAAHAALGALPDVARIPTHLFKFLSYRQAFAGWGSSLRWAVREWYDRYNDPSYLGYHLAKYRSRYGWTHRDVLRKAHPDPSDLSDDATRALLRWAVEGMDGMEAEKWDRLPMVVQEYERFRREDLEAEDVARSIREYGLPREVVPSEYLGEDVVWEALADDMPTHALVRNLGNLSKRGVLEPMSEREAEVCSSLTDAERIEAARLHPMDVLIAQTVYSSGGGRLGSSSWPVSDAVVEALEEAFDLSFANVEPSGRRHLLALDVSGSMTGGSVAGIEWLSPRQAAAAMALFAARTEPSTHGVAFSDDGDSFTHEGSRGGYRSGAVRPFPIRSGQSLSDLVERTKGLPFAGTDCALPMLYALERGISVDVFVVLTDNETWSGDVHPSQALRRYREQTGIDAKLAVVAMTSNGFSIADPEDAGMLDVVGLDSATPRILADFARE